MVWDLFCIFNIYIIYILHSIYILFYQQLLYIEVLWTVVLNQLITRYQVLLLRNTNIADTNENEEFLPNSNFTYHEMREKVMAEYRASLVKARK